MKKAGIPIVPGLSFPEEKRTEKLTEQNTMKLSFVENSVKPQTQNRDQTLQENQEKVIESNKTSEVSSPPSSVESGPELNKAMDGEQSEGEEGALNSSESETEQASVKEKKKAKSKRKMSNNDNNNKKERSKSLVNELNPKEKEKDIENKSATKSSIGPTDHKIAGIDLYLGEIIPRRSLRRCSHETSRKVKSAFEGQMEFSDDGIIRERSSVPEPSKTPTKTSSKAKSKSPITKQPPQIPQKTNKRVSEDTLSYNQTKKQKSSVVPKTQTKPSKTKEQAQKSIESHRNSIPQKIIDVEQHCSKAAMRFALSPITSKGKMKALSGSELKKQMSIDVKKAVERLYSEQADLLEQTENTDMNDIEISVTIKDSHDDLISKNENAKVIQGARKELLEKSIQSENFNELMKNYTEMSIATEASLEEKNAQIDRPKSLPDHIESNSTSTFHQIVQPTLELKESPKISFSSHNDTYQRLLEQQELLLQQMHAIQTEIQQVRYSNFIANRVQVPPQNRQTSFINHQTPFIQSSMPSPYINNRNLQAENQSLFYTGYPHTMNMVQQPAQTSVNHPDPLREIFLAGIRAGKEMEQGLGSQFHHYP